MLSIPFLKTDLSPCEAASSYNTTDKARYMCRLVPSHPSLSRIINKRTTLSMDLITVSFWLLILFEIGGDISGSLSFWDDQVPKFDK